jgi:hypothetical protein
MLDRSGDQRLSKENQKYTDEETSFDLSSFNIQVHPMDIKKYL